MVLLLHTRRGHLSHPHLPGVEKATDRAGAEQHSVVLDSAAMEITGTGKACKSSNCYFVGWSPGTKNSRNTLPARVPQMNGGMNVTQ